MSNHPNEIQIGGDHYRKAGNLQHWDMLPDCGGFGWEYYLGMATKYMTRVKDETLDPGKAGHTIDKLISLVQERRVPSEFQSTKGIRVNCDVGGRKVDVPYYLEGYFAANQIDPAGDEAQAITLLMQVRTLDELIVAREVIRRLEPVAHTVQARPMEIDATRPAAVSVMAPLHTDATAAYVNQDGADKGE